MQSMSRTNRGATALKISFVKAIAPACIYQQTINKSPPGIKLLLKIVIILRQPSCEMSTYHMVRIPAGCRPQRHRGCPSKYHTQCRIVHQHIPPLSPLPDHPGHSNVHHSLFLPGSTHSCFQQVDGDLQ